MRKHKKTISRVSNQIIIESSSYTCFKLKDNGNTWIKIPSLTKGKRLCLPLNTSITPKGQLRLILKDNQVAIHYCIDKEIKKNCRIAKIEIDIGHTEVFTDSNGYFY